MDIKRKFLLFLTMNLKPCLKSQLVFCLAYVTFRFFEGHLRQNITINIIHVESCYMFKVLLVH